MSGNDKRMIGSLRDLPQEIAPPRDLWKGIEAQIAAERKHTAGTAAPRSSRAVPRRRVLRHGSSCLAALLPPASALRPNC